MANGARAESAACGTTRTLRNAERGKPRAEKAAFLPAARSSPFTNGGGHWTTDAAMPSKVKKWSQVGSVHPDPCVESGEAQGRTNDIGDGSAVFRQSGFCDWRRLWHWPRPLRGACAPGRKGHRRRHRQKGRAAQHRTALTCRTRGPVLPQRLPPRRACSGQCCPLFA